MVNITTPQDIIQALLSDPELLRQARQAIMTEEVMALPAQFTTMLAEIAELRHTQNSMLQTQNPNKMPCWSPRQDAKTSAPLYRRQHDDLGRFRGNYAADAARQNTSFHIL